MRHSSGQSERAKMPYMVSRCRAVSGWQIQTSRAGVAPIRGDFTLGEWDKVLHPHFPLGGAQFRPEVGGQLVATDRHP